MKEWSSRKKENGGGEREAGEKGRKALSFSFSLANWKEVVIQGSREEEEEGEFLVLYDGRNGGERALLDNKASTYFNHINESFIPKKIDLPKDFDIMDQSFDPLIIIQKGLFMLSVP